MAISASLSDLLGYTSIGLWLCAQFPQVMVNWRLKSAEGLALPFLVNWLFGDISNFVGCILTHQLPFQTYLATYFCCLDVCLLFQYFYYTPLSRLFLPSPTQIAPPTPSYSYAQLPRSQNVSLVRGRSKSLSLEIERGLRRLSLLRGIDVVAAEEGDAMHRRGGTWADVGLGRVTSGTEESVVRESGRRSRSKRAGSKRRSGAEGVRRAGMVFLSVGGLLGFGRLAGGLPRANLDTRVDVGGHVIGTLVVPYVPSVSLDPVLSAALPSTVVLLVDPPPTPENPHGGEHRHGEEKPSMERVIGRVSAWTCTTLYLTSRLPQIWKNFVRKSVEGLSMSLFIFAFLGNLFYVLSIVTSSRLSGPTAEARAFIFESIPYILGSGGVLVFDMIIVLQGRMYGGRTPLDLHVEDQDETDVTEQDVRGRSRGRRVSPIGEQEGDALLSDATAYTQDGEGYGAVPPSPPSHA